MAQFELWRSLLEAAIQTPSPHNVQPWRIRLVSETEAERVINEDPVLASEVHSFQLKVIEDEQLKSNLQVHLELSKNRGDQFHSQIENLQELVFSGLIRVNQDFREVTKMFDRSQVQLFLHEYGNGPICRTRYTNQKQVYRLTQNLLASSGWTPNIKPNG
jgi:hypothetical protein